MVTTRRRRVPTVVPESPESSARDTESVRDIDIEPVLRGPPVAPGSPNSASPTLPPTRAPSRAPTVRSLRSSRRSTAAPSLVPSIVRSRTRRSPATPPGSPPRTPPPLPAMPRAPRLRRSPSSPSVASFAGPGLRGARLLAIAPSSARNSFLNAFDALNDEFAAQLCQRGVPLPGGECPLCCLPYLFPRFSSFPFLQWRGVCAFCHPSPPSVYSVLRIRDDLLTRLATSSAGIRIRVALFSGIRIRVAGFFSIRIRVALHAYTFVLLFLAYAFALLVARAFAFLWRPSPRSCCTLIFTLFSFYTFIHV